MANYQVIVAAALIPATVFASATSNGTSTTWNAANVATALANNQAAFGTAFTLAAGNDSHLLADLQSTTLLRRRLARKSMGR